MSTIDVHQIDLLRSDTLPYVRSTDYYDDKKPEVESVGTSNDPTNVPEPVAYLAMRKAIAQATQEVLSEAPAVVIPLMPLTDPTDVPEPRFVEKVTPPSNSFTEVEEAFFRGESQETAQKPEIVVKSGWLSRFPEQVGSAVESFGRFLDTAVPTSMAGLVATVLGMTAPTVFSNTNYSGTQEAVTASSPTELNTLPLEKNKEIVKVTGGERADYLYSPEAYRDFLKELSKPGSGFSAVLTHPATQTAENIAEFINLVEIHFSKRAADLVESNAAAMHLSASQIQALR